METIDVFVIILESGNFKLLEGIPTNGRFYQNGDPVMIRGQEAVILGIGVTKHEAKKNGEEYYQRIYKWHHGEEDGCCFATQQEPTTPTSTVLPEPIQTNEGSSSGSSTNFSEPECNQ